MKSINEDKKSVKTPALQGVISKPKGETTLEQSIADFFKVFAFPTKNKNPSIPKGESWELNNPLKKKVHRIDRLLYPEEVPALDCGHARIVVADFDSYKPSFKNSEESKKFFKKVKGKSRFCYHTKSGGQHYFFKMPKGEKIDCSAPFEGIEIKAAGGYVVLWGFPFPPGEFKTFEDFYKALPVWSYGSLKRKKTTQQAGKGQNNEYINSIFSTARKARPIEIAETAVNIAKGVLNSDGKTTEQELIKKLAKSIWDGFSSSPYFQIPQKNISAKREDERKNQQQNPLDDKLISEVPEVEPKAFFNKILWLREFNLFFGSPKVGKTRAILYFINEALDENELCSIISTENDPGYMLAPLLKKMNCAHKFITITDQIAKGFKDNQSGLLKVNSFINRLWDYLMIKITATNQNIKCILIDPLPRFIDWNNEELATTMIDELRFIAKKFDIAIIGVRNEGKNTQYKTSQLYKGSSGIGDTTRQANRGLVCHPKSAIGKEHKGEKTFVIYTELSSFAENESYLFKLKIKDNVAIPEFIKKLEINTDAVQYQCSRESGKSTRQRILDYMEKQSPKHATLDDLRDFFEDTVPEQTLKNILSGKGFDSVKRGGVTFYFPELKK